MAQGSEFPLRKPPGFHWDFFLLGITTFIAGLLGFPAPNGLIPQAPIHTRSLTIMGSPLKGRQGSGEGSHHSRTLSRSFNFNEESDDPQPSVSNSFCRSEVPVAVVEQRVSNLAQGSLCLVLLTSPFLHVLNLIPRGVLAGLLYVILPEY